MPARRQFQQREAPAGPGQHQTPKRGVEPADVANAPAARAGSLGPGSVLGLQGQAGNRATAALLAAGQPKLTVGAAGDQYERQADTVAAQVVARLRSAGSATPAGEVSTALDDEGQVLPAGTVSRVQRRADVIGAAGGDVDASTEQAINAARSGGRPLPGSLRRSMEGAFNADFAGVKVHTGEAAHSLNHQVGAVAFTVGPDIFLGRSAPELSSPAGHELLAHELTHTVQQGAAAPKQEEA